MRGAIQVDQDDRDEIISAVAEMIDAVLSRNDFTADDLISILFTVTPDIRSEFPAYATRKAGITDVPMMCSIEIPVDGAMGLNDLTLGREDPARAQSSEKSGSP